MVLSLAGRFGLRSSDTCGWPGILCSNESVANVALQTRSAVLGYSGVLDVPAFLLNVLVSESG